MIIEHSITDGDIALRSLDKETISEGYVSWLNDPEISCFLESRFQEHTLETAIGFVEGCNKSSSSLLLGIFYEGRHIGNIKADINADHKTSGLGLLIGDKSLQGKGIGSKAITMLGRYLFEKFDIFKTNAGIYQSNISSIKAFEKAGFEIEYVKHDHIINKDGDREDVIMMVKYASE